MSVTLRSQMPALTRAWLPDFFDRPAPPEKRATCDSCAMCARPDSPTSSAARGIPATYFRPEVKCCSYHPTLPNYLVGAALRDSSPDFARGRERLRKKIAARVGVTCTWLAAPRKYLVLYEAARDSSFGRSESLLCPYFDREASNCSIWPYRESVCATFFCKYEAGAAGQLFWRAWKRYLSHVEVSLARYAATAVRGTPPPADLPRTQLTQEDLEDKPPTDADYTSYWRPWVGREEPFYIECASVVESLQVAERERVIDDAGGRELLAEAVKRYDAAMTPELAPFLTLNPGLHPTKVTGDNPGAFVTPYSGYDPLFLTQDLYDALGQFTATEPVKQTLERLAHDHDTELPEALLLEMQLHAVMVPPEPTTG